MAFPVHDSKRFAERYKALFFIPRHLVLTERQLNENWESFVKKYVRNGVVSHFRQRTIEDGEAFELSKIKGRRKDENENEARREGKSNGEVAFSRALRTAYELHSLGRTQVEVLAALGAEVRTNKVRQILFTSKEKGLNDILDALGEKSGGIITSLRQIKGDSSGIDNIDYALSEKDSDRYAAFIRMIQISLELQQVGDEKRIDCFKRVIKNYGNVRQQLANVVRTYSYLFRYYFNINPQMSRIGNELGEFAVYCENAEGYEALDRIRDNIVSRQAEHFNTILSAMAQVTRKLCWRVTHKQARLLEGFSDKGELVIQQREEPKGLLEFVDKAFSRPFKYINFHEAFICLTNAKVGEDSKTQEALNNFKKKYAEIMDQTRLALREGSKPVDFQDIFFDNLGRHFAYESPDQWYLLEQILRKSPHLATIIRTDRIDDILGIRLVVLPTEVHHNSLHSRLFADKFDRARIPSSAASALKEHREIVRDLADKIFLKLIEHLPHKGGDLSVVDIENRIGVVSYDSRAPVTRRVGQPLTFAEIKQMGHYNAAHITLLVGGHPFEVQVIGRDDHHQTHARLPGLTKISYFVERLARVPTIVGQTHASYPVKRWLDIHNRIQYHLYLADKKKVPPGDRMREIENILQKSH